MKQWTSDSDFELDNVRNENPLLPLLSTPPCELFGISATTPLAKKMAAAAKECHHTSASVREGSGVSATYQPLLGKRQEELTSVSLEFGDEYVGEVKIDGGAKILHGYGTLRSPLGKHCYEGGFVNNKREGYGKLTTGRYVLYSKWKANCPDLANTARVDYSNGDRYSGILSLQQDSSAAEHTTRSLRARISKFSVWVQKSVLVRVRWGELAGANGDRYFGQWENNLPSGFGCLLTSNGDRYVGLFKEGKFHDTGSLFLRSHRTHGSTVSLLSGADFVLTSKGFSQRLGNAARGDKMKKEGNEEEEKRGKKDAKKNDRTDKNSEENNDNREDVRATSMATADVNSKKKRWGGIIYDGVWENGCFVGEGYVTLPCGSRLAAEWRSATLPTNGSLFLGSFSNFMSLQACSNLNARGWFRCFHWEPLFSDMSGGLKMQEHSLCALYRERLLNATTEEEVHEVLSDFCGNHKTLQNALKLFRRCFYFFYGACGKSSEIGSGLGSNGLGWCHFCATYGGCIHPSRGRLIEVCDVDLAVTDIISFVCSVERWVMAVLGDYTALADCRSGHFVARRVLDYVFGDVHDVLFNLYVQAFSEEDELLSLALERLREHTTLDDTGVVFARQESAERLFDPYSDAIHSIEQLGHNIHTFTGKLRILAQWSREIDLAAQLAQVNVDDRLFSVNPQWGCMQLEYGSADDLLPIYQYVLIKARLQHLYAHTRLLIDFSSENIFMEFASPESFFVTTLQACVTILAKLHPLLRDQYQVLAPPSLFEDRLCAAVRSIKSLSVSFLDAYSSHYPDEGTFDSLDADELRKVGVGYLRAWLPEALDVLSTRSCGAGRVVRVEGLLRGATARRLAHLQVGVCCPRKVALFCWLVAANVLSVLRLRLGIAVGAKGVLQVDVDPSFFLRLYSSRCDGADVNAGGAVLFFLQEPLQPSFLNSAAAFLFTVL